MACETKELQPPGRGWTYYRRRPLVRPWLAGEKHRTMAARRKHIWYVSFEVPRAPIGEKRPYSRKTRTFQSEIEAKTFAREKLQDSPTVNAGTLNPFLPKRLITSAQIYEWLEAPLSSESEDLPHSEQSSVRTRR
jgi:hypothetical protein